MNQYNIIITGVGGQGVVMAGNITGEVALSSGYDVKKTDTLGMAQRGGSVISHLRIAEKVFSPLIREGEADILLAFEKLEAARWSHYLKTIGKAIINNLALPPLAVNLGNESYPDDEDIICTIKRYTENLLIVNASSKAKELGHVRTLNIYMLGCLSKFTPFRKEIWQDCIRKNLPIRLIDINLTAFENGEREIEDIIRKKEET